MITLMASKMKALKYVEIQNNACFTTSMVISEQ